MSIDPLVLGLVGETILLGFVVFIAFYIIKHS